MTIQLSTTVRNATLDQRETTIGTAPHLKIRTGAQPADCGTADSGTSLVDVTLPSDWMADASAGVKVKAGTWSATAGATGTAGHYRIYQGATCHLQGSVTITGGGGDMTLDNTSIASGQVVTVTAYQWTEGNP